MRSKFASLSNLTLIVALSLSGVAAYYSIIGLTAIFAGAVIPIIVMGAILEIAKLITTVWLRTYWAKCGWVLKSYLVPSVIILALITSMGIFGFLSKAHIDQGIGGGDVSAKIGLIDEKIKTQRENIKSSRDALAQMDLQVNNVITKGDSEKSAERSVQIRRQQSVERGKLQKEIEVANAAIGVLNEERAPIAGTLRKVEAEVGPIKYIAAMIYGDDPDQNILEKAVRWVIILLILVFDPLAVALLLAANQSREWDTEVKLTEDIPVAEPEPSPTVEVQPDPLPEIVPEPLSEIDQYAYLKKPFKHFENLQPMVALPAEVTEPVIVEEIAVVAEPVTVVKVAPPAPEKQYQDLPGGYVAFKGKHMTKNVLKDMRPDLFLTTDPTHPISTNFGIVFPTTAGRGDVFVRVDTLPNQVYKFDGEKWIPVNKEQTTTYLQEPNYIQHLIAKIDSGEYDVELLTEHEKQQIEEFLNSQKG